MKQLMKPMEANPMRLLAGACSLVLTLCLSQAGVAQQTAGAAPPAAAAPAKTLPSVAFSSLAPGAVQAQAKPVVEEEEETAKPKKPGSEGLKVHGHWKIVAKNPDGTIVNTVEFENSLQIGSGDALLGQLLTGQSTIAEWAIGLFGDTGLCLNQCFISPVATASDYLYSFCGSSLPTLPVPAVCLGGLTLVYHPNVSSTGPTTPASLVLTGTFTAASAGDITRVVTAPYACTYLPDDITDASGTTYTPTLSPVSAASCLTASTTTGLPAFEPTVYPPFTGTGLSAPFQFTAGQLVQVSVTISFS